MKKIKIKNFAISLVCILLLSVTTVQADSSGEPLDSYSNGTSDGTTTTTTPETDTTCTGVTYDVGAAYSIPASVTGEKVDGSATAVDYIISNGREFYTFQTKDGNTYYLIIDNEKQDSNVYFLTEINEENLDLSNQVLVSPTATPTPVIEVTQPQQETSKAKTNNNVFIVLVVFLGALAAGYYVKIYKPKKDKENPLEPLDDEDLIDDDHYSSDEMYSGDDYDENM